MVVGSSWFLAYLSGISAQSYGASIHHKPDRTRGRDREHTASRVFALLALVVVVDAHVKGALANFTFNRIVGEGDYSRTIKTVIRGIFRRSIALFTGLLTRRHYTRAACRDRF